MPLPPLRLNPAHDVNAYRAVYAQGEFVQISGLFEPEIATEISKVLTDMMRWDLAYADPEKGIIKLSYDEIQSIGQEGMAERMGRVMGLAARNYGYCYNVYHMSSALASGRDNEHPIHDLTRFLRGPEMQAFVGAIIGSDQVVDMDAKATLYAPGNFLTRHVDEGAHNERLAAYTIGFTEGWQTDWGGLLMFLDPQSTNVTSGWVPRFNTLNVFNGRKVHSVSAVSAFAPAGRYSIAGWALGPAG